MRKGVKCYSRRGAEIKFGKEKMFMMYFDERIYCPCCGKVIIRRLKGVMENNCPYCKKNLKVIVDEKGMTIFSDIA